MRTEVVHPLDPETLELFASKGQRCAAHPSRAGEANAVKLRRVMQILRDLDEPGPPTRRILDLACGEGVYSIEAALRGDEVLALDGRTDRLEDGARAAERLGLSGVRFGQEDVRRVSEATHGRFDVILLLGILYHLDTPDVFHVLDRISAMCRRTIVVDTHVCLTPTLRVDHAGRTFEGDRFREHDDSDPDAVRRTRLLSSLDNTFSFRFTKESLVRALIALGFTSVFECHAPLEALKPRDRVTLVALKGVPVRISTYPWINDRSEEEIERTLRQFERADAGEGRRARRSLGTRIEEVVNRVLRPLGCRIVRV